jgi:phosphoribosyl 1,2-cyclic phosphodiesterase
MTQSTNFLKFWGVRGSIASPGPDTQKYGGNTPCVELRVDGNIFVLDGGTGLKRLGQSLISQGEALDIKIFLSHLHWDHIQGIPFFSPAFMKKNKITFLGERKGEQSLKEILEAQMRSPNFPVPLSIMQAPIEFEELVPWQVKQFGSLTVTTTPLNHTNGCLGFRFDFHGKTVVYCTDTEHKIGSKDENVVRLAMGADLFIYDSMYTEQEYLNGKIGWGHSTYEEAIELARLAQVKKLIFFHHDPEHYDQFLDEKLCEWQEKSKNAHDSFEIEMATEGKQYQLDQS